MVQTSRSYAEICRKMGYSTGSGSANRALKDCFQFYNIDSSSLLGQRWAISDLRFFRKGVDWESGRLKTLIYVRGHVCECCGITEWQGKPAPLQCHHIDGDRYNNELENLQVLCANCHAQTDNWCNRKRNK